MASVLAGSTFTPSLVNKNPRSSRYALHMSWTGRSASSARHWNVNPANASPKGIRAAFKSIRQNHVDRPAALSMSSTKGIRTGLVLHGLRLGRMTPRASILSTSF